MLSYLRESALGENTVMDVSIEGSATIGGNSSKLINRRGCEGMRMTAITEG